MSTLSLRDLKIIRRDNQASLLYLPNLEIQRGQCTALVGESGSGKSLTALALLGLLPAALHAEANIIFDQQESAMNASAHHALRGRHLAWMPQDPLAALHPLRSVGDQLRESLRTLRGLNHTDAAKEALKLLEQFELPQPIQLQHRYPHELSGGQRQRVLLALALSGQPEFLIADEPTSALDPRLAYEALLLLDKLRREQHLGLLLISHDLPQVRRFAQQVTVLYRGECIEHGETESVFSNPQHDYTKRLIRSHQLGSPVAKPEKAAPILELDNVSVRYQGADKLAVQNVSFRLHAGESIAIAGESGSGKSSLARAMLRLLRGDTTGRLQFEGQSLLTISSATLRSLRKRIGVVFQDPFASLNPRHPVWRVVSEPLLIQSQHADLRERAGQALQQVGISDDALDRFPHQFSGGQRQRIAIARALISKPSLLICDEAISALDAEYRSEILSILRQLKQQGIAIVFITHDMSAARAIGDQLLVMHNAQAVEQGPLVDLLQKPQHHYTQSLIKASELG
jgi:peptide/nickel transport system ATP-binding protein